MIDIEVSDYVEVLRTDYTNRFNTIDTKLSTIEQKINSSGSSSSTSTQSNTKTLTYQSNGDANGVCYWIGTNYGTEVWTNPHTARRVTAVMSSIGQGTPANMVNR